MGEEAALYLFICYKSLSLGLGSRKSDPIKGSMQQLACLPLRCVLCKSIGHLGLRLFTPLPS